MYHATSSLSLRDQQRSRTHRHIRMQTNADTIKIAVSLVPHMHVIHFAVCIHASQQCGVNAVTGAACLLACATAPYAAPTTAVTTALCPQL
eukprot:3672-Heterococcus_DN1.PRE.7